MQPDVGAHLFDRERGRVRRDDCVRRDAAQLGDDLALHLELLEHGLQDEIAAFELLPAGAAVDDRREKRLLHADVRADRLQGLVNACLVEVAQNDGHFEASQEKRCELRCHQPRADDADLLHLARRCLRDLESQSGGRGQCRRQDGIAACVGELLHRSSDSTCA